MAKKKTDIILYDTTLRDGSQAEDITFSVADKVKYASVLDSLGLHYIEGGWPGSNPKDIEFFKEMKKPKNKLKFSKLVAFGSTRKAGVTAAKDKNIQALLESKVPVVTIFGKSWKLHVRSALGVSLDENLHMIYDSVKYLKSKVDKVFYDAEHFFDGFVDDPDYAMKTVMAAVDGGADYIVLCDTNGGMLTEALTAIVEDVCKLVDVPVGVHVHNDSETAVSNSLGAVRSGATMVQGTINGFGERCGNANLVSIIPALKLKMGYNCVTNKQLKTLKNASSQLYELINMTHRKHQPYVGDSAFAHKGGIHVSAVLKNSDTYEHIKPEIVGNRQRVLVSDLSGRSNILYKAKEYGLDLSGKNKNSSKVIKDILDEVKKLEHEGFQYEGAEASFELLIRRAQKKKEKYFKLHGFRVTDEVGEDGVAGNGDHSARSEATIKIEVGGKVEHTVAVGNGPVNALDSALRKALESFYPSLKEVKLLDFKVRVVSGGGGTASKVRVLVESGDKSSKWGTVGLSENVVEAAWQALVDALEYKLYKDKKHGKV